jgi:hypothetical protein
MPDVNQPKVSTGKVFSSSNESLASVGTSTLQIIASYAVEVVCMNDAVKGVQYVLQGMGNEAVTKAFDDVERVDGSTIAEGVVQAGFSQRLISMLQDNGGLAPKWQLVREQGSWVTNSADNPNWRKAA